MMKLRKEYLIILFFVSLITLTFFTNTYVIFLLTLGGIYILLAVSFNLVVGFTGQHAFCHAAFYGIGAYASALMELRLGFPMWVNLPLSGLFTALIAFTVGYPALKLRGFFFGITTLTFGWLVNLIFRNWSEVTGGSVGLMGISRPSIIIPGLLKISLKSDQYYCIFILGITALCVLFIYWLTESPLGRVFKAIREDEILTNMMGFNASIFKVFSFSISAFFAGIAGVLHGPLMGIVSPVSFTVSKSLDIFIMTVFGGVGTTLGPLLGAIILVILPEFLRVVEQFRLVYYGLALLIVIRFMPNGIVGLIQERLNIRSRLGNVQMEKTVKKEM